MEDFIRGLIDDLPSWVRVVASPITRRVLAVFRWIDSLLRIVRIPWRGIVNAAKKLRIGIADLGYQTAHTLQWMLTVKIPAVRNNIIATVKAWAALAIKIAVAVPLRLVQNLSRWALREVARLTGFGINLRDWAVRRFAEAWVRLHKLSDRVFGTWLTPNRMAAWLIGALWIVFWRFAYGQIDKIADYFWRRRQALLLRSVAIIERLLGRLI